MKKKIFTSIILSLAIIFCISFVKADNTIEINNLDDIKNLIEFSANGTVDIYDVLQAYKDLSENYSNEAIADAI